MKKVKLNGMVFMFTDPYTLHQTIAALTTGGREVKVTFRLTDKKKVKEIWENLPTLTDVQKLWETIATE